MARGPVRLGAYDQRTRPQSQQQPFIQPVDNGGAQIARGIAALGQGASDMAGALQAEERLRLAREEDDARVYVSAAMAQARARANEIRRTAFAEAPDGWRGVPERVSKDFGALREQALSAAPTPAAQRFLTQAFDSYQPLMLEDVAAAQQSARESWQFDTLRTAIDTGAGVLAVDPGQYEAMRAQQLSVLEGLQNANHRRDLTAHMEQTYAGALIGGMIDRDPNGALRILQDPNAGGPVSALGALRGRFIDQARAEIDRRAAQWRASVREQVQGALAMLERGEQPINPPSIDTVRSALGEDMAAAYEIDMQTYRAASEMNGLSNAQLMEAMNAAPSDGATRQERLSNSVRRSAAANILELRQTDPMLYAVRQGLVADTEDMTRAINQGDFDAIGLRMRARAATAQEQSRRLGTPPAPLTRSEAAQVRSLLDGLSPEQRVAALQNLRSGASMPRRGDGGVYAAMLAQIYQDNPAAFAGAAAVTRSGYGIDANNTRIDAETVGRRMLDGAALLNPAARDTNGNGQTERQRSNFSMPSNAALEGAFQNYVGDAYAGDPNGYRRAYEAFRAYYAGAAAERGLNGSGLSFMADGRGGGTLTGDGEAVALAGEAAQVAVGNLRENRHGGAPGLPVRTYLPWGMNEDQFMGSIRAGWPQIRERFANAELTDDPNDYDYARDTDGFYTLFYRGRAVPDGEGGLVRVKPRARQQH
ncbi:MAG: hypothetical protein BroJett013_07350 [Alphaproteobacteria bacterium]|nr:MAG: hypothetical protein BroJett013_07350 [Alphaproteobacteria bacterium]